MENYSAFSFISPRHQIFSLPNPLIVYITRYPISSPNGYKKLQQTCKYFFSKMKLIVLDSVVDNRDKFVYITNGRNIYPFLRNFQYWITSGIFTKMNFTFRRDHIYRCDLKVILLRGVTLSYHDIDFLLLSNKKLKDVGWRNVTIQNYDSAIQTRKDEVDFSAGTTAR